MARDPLYGVTINGWEQLATSMEANAEDFPHLEAQRQELADTLVQVRDVSTRQAALTAAKQEATQELQTLLAEGRKLATFLRVGIRQRYGNRSEKLVEFKLQPFRSRTRPAAPPATQEPKPADPVE